MADTPNYLGFLAQMPKKTGLQTAIESGTEMYGTLQKFAGEKQRQALEAEKLKQEEMVTKEMPSTIERARKKDEMGIKESELKLEALPAEIARKKQTEEQTIAQNHMLLQAYPKLLQQQVTSGDLKILNDRLTAEISKMSTEDLKHHKVQNDMADIAETAMSNPSAANEMYKIKRKGWIALGEDPKLIPDNLDDPKAATLLNLALAHAPNRSDTRAFENEKAMQVLKNQGAVDLATAKALSEGTTFDKKLQEESAKQFVKDKLEVRTAAKNAAEVSEDVKQMLNFAEKGSGQFGYISGRTMVLNTTGQEILKASNKLILDEFKSLPHIGRGGDMLWNSILAQKPSNLNTKEAFVTNAKTWQAASEYILQYSNFFEQMEALGVKDASQIQNAWRRFEEQNDVVDEDHQVHPEVPKKWPEFFKNNPDALPASLATKLRMKMIAQKEGLQQKAEPMPNPATVQNKYSNSVVQEGVVPAYVAPSASDLITGGS